jgi:hypothetical protein
MALASSSLKPSLSTVSVHNFWQQSVVEPLRQLVFVLRLATPTFPTSFGSKLLAEFCDCES